MSLIAGLCFGHAPLRLAAAELRRISSHGDRRRVLFTRGFRSSYQGAGLPPVQVPNPKRKVPLDLKSLARSYTEVAIQSLSSIARQSESDAARVSACTVLLDRGWGKADQPHSGGIDGDIRITIRTILEDNRAKIIEAAKLIEGNDHDKPE